MAKSKSNKSKDTVSVVFNVNVWGGTRGTHELTREEASRLPTEGAWWFKVLDGVDEPAVEQAVVQDEPSEDRVEYDGDSRPVD